MDLQCAIPMLEEHPKQESRAQLGACMQAVYRLVPSMQHRYRAWLRKTPEKMGRRNEPEAFKVLMKWRPRK